MKKLIVFLLVMMPLYMQAQVKADSVFVYNASSYLYKLDVRKFNILLSRAKVSNYLEEPSSESIALEIFIKGKWYLFEVYGQDLIFDITAKKKYQVKNVDDLAFLAKAIDQHMKAMPKKK